MTYRPVRICPGRRAVMVGALTALGPSAFAQGSSTFPTRPVTLVVPFPAGTANDILARFLAPHLGTQLGQPVIVDNRPGGGGTLGMGQVVRSQPNGLTLIMVTTSSVPIARALFRNLNFDPARDLSLVGITNSAPSALVVRGNDTIDGLPGLVAFASRPGQPPIRYFSPGTGSSQHLSAVQFSRMTGIPMEHVPYRGVGEAMTGLLAGETTFGFASVPSVAGFLSAGQLRALGTTGPDRATALPTVPTLASLGYPDFAETYIWFGLAVPTGVPDDIKATLRTAVSAIMQAPALREQLARAGFDPVPPMDGDAANALVQRQVAFWGELVRQSGASVD